jgi:flagellar FliL protein
MTMPQDEEKTTVENSAENTAEAKPKGSKKLLMLLGFGVGAIVVGVALALFVLKPMMSDSAAEANDSGQIEQHDSSKADSHGEAKKDAHGSKDAKDHGKEGGSLVYAIDDIVVNPAGTGGSRFLSASFAFELEAPYLEAEFTAKEAMVRDALITILTSKTVPQLTDPKQKEIVRYQIKKRVSDLLETDDLANVFFTDFVLQ